MAFKFVVRCKQCGERRRANALGPACPNCGLMTVLVSTFQMEVLGSTEAQATLLTDSLTYPRELMIIADELITRGRWSVAVIVVHTACEVATGGVISEAFDRGGARHLKDWVMGLRRGYNLGNPQILELYTALTGDNVPAGVGNDKWIKFKTSSELRNRIIHRGAQAGEPDARASYEAGNALLTHLESRTVPSI